MIGPWSLWRAARSPPALSADLSPLHVVLAGVHLRHCPCHGLILHGRFDTVIAFTSGNIQCPVCAPRATECTSRGDNQASRKRVSEPPHCIVLVTRTDSAQPCYRPGPSPPAVHCRIWRRNASLGARVGNVPRNLPARSDGRQTRRADDRQFLPARRMPWNRSKRRSRCTARSAVPTTSGRSASSSHV